MLSYQVVEFGKPLQPRRYEDPVPQGTEVLVRILGCGVCHSDLHQADGYFDLGGGKRIELSERVALPYTPGHEMVGEVMALGPDAKGLKVGDRGIVFPWIGCNQCAECAAGNEIFCPQPRFFGGRRNGGYADRIVVDHPRYLVDYGDTPMALAGTYACSGVTSFTALKKIPETRADDTIMTIGAGGVGTSGILIAPAVHKAKLIVADIDEGKRKAAKENGAWETVDPKAEGALARVHELSGGGVAGVVDFVGSVASAQFGLDAMKRGGTYVIVGLYGGALPLQLPLVPMRSINIRGSYVGNLRDLNELMALVRAGKVKSMKTETRPLEQANEAMAELRAGKVIGRLVLTPAF